MQHPGTNEIAPKLDFVFILPGSTMISEVEHAMESFSRPIQPVRGTKAVQAAVSLQAWRESGANEKV